MGIEPSGPAGEGRRAFGGGGLNAVRHFNSGGTRRLCLRLGFAFVPGGVVSCSLIKLRSATMNDISVGMGGGGSTGVLWRMRCGWDGCSGGRGNVGPTRSLAGTLLRQGGLRGWCTDSGGSHTI